jgi:hypothetical protein
MPTTSKTPAKKTAGKKQAAAKASQPSLTRTVNMGPKRGDNSFPPGNRKMPNVTERAPGTKAKGSA